jgi:membrane fusion protein (multidrug efflux system)
MASSDYPRLLDDPSHSPSIIMARLAAHLVAHQGGPSLSGHRPAKEQSDARVADPKALPGYKSFLPTGKALKRAALGLALGTALGTAVDYGYRYWTVGQYRQSTDDA